MTRKGQVLDDSRATSDPIRTSQLTGGLMTDVATEFWLLAVRCCGWALHGLGESGFHPWRSSPHRNHHVEWRFGGNRNTSSKFFASPTAQSAVRRSRNISEHPGCGLGPSNAVSADHPAWSAGGIEQRGPRGSAASSAGATGGAGSRAAAEPITCRPITSSTGPREARPTPTTWSSSAGRHHRLVHERGWSITGSPDHGLMFVNPTASPFATDLRRCGKSFGSGWVFRGGSPRHCLSIR
jgi:hypothetical protein